MTIFELDDSIGSILNKIDELVDMETGEITDVDAFEVLKSELDSLEEVRDKKISNVACWYKQLIADAEAIKAEKQNLEKRQKYCENKAESLKKYLAYALNGESFKDSRVSISYRKSEGIHFDDNFDIQTLPKQYLKVTLDAKKTEIKNAIKNGNTFEGISLVSKSNIQIK